MKAWLTKRKATKRQILSLVGLLQHATKVVRLGRTFLTRIYSTAAKLKQPFHWKKLSAVFRSDLHWWHVFGMKSAFCLQWRCPRLLPDASSSWKCGAWFAGWCFQWRCPRLLPDASSSWGCGAWFAGWCFQYDITLQIMCGIKDCLPRHHSHAFNLTSCFGLLVTCCLAFFSFLWVSEFTVLIQDIYNPDTHLSLTDISLDNRPHLIAVYIKTDTFQKGVTLYVGATNHPVCPVAGILPYLALRGGQPGLFFLTKEGKGLTWMSYLKNSRYTHVTTNTNSFQIGAATTAAEAGIPDRRIKILGRWQSNTYQQYIWMQPHSLARFSQQLVSPSNRSHV